MKCGKVNLLGAVCRSVRQKAVHELEQEIDEYTEEDGKIDTVNIKFINSNAKSLAIIAKLKTISYQN